MLLFLKWDFLYFQDTLPTLSGYHFTTKKDNSVTKKFLGVEELYFQKLQKPHFDPGPPSNAKLRTSVTF